MLDPPVVAGAVLGAGAVLAAVVAAPVAPAPVAVSAALVPVGLWSAERQARRHRCRGPETSHAEQDSAATRAAGVF